MWLKKGNSCSKEMLFGSTIPKERRDSLPNYNVPGKAPM